MKYLDFFLEHLRLNHYAKKTIDNYRYTMLRVKKYFRQKKIEDEKIINENHIIEYVKYLQENNTVNWLYFQIVVYLRKYFKFLVESKIIFINPMENITNPKQLRNRIKPLPKDELLKSLEKIKTDTDYGIRSKVIFELLYSTGIRPFELLNIKLNHIDLKKKEIFIEKGKKNKDRVVPVGTIAIFWIEKYLHDVRPKYLKDKSVNYLIIPLIGVCKKLSRNGLTDVIKYTFKKYGIKKFKPYSLRSSCATHLLLNGMEITYIQKLLGHNNFTTTQGYLDIKTLDLKSVLDIKHPRNKY